LHHLLKEKAYGEIIIKILVPQELRMVEFIEPPEIILETL